MRFVQSIGGINTFGASQGFTDNYTYPTASGTTANSSMGKWDGSI